MVVSSSPVQLIARVMVRGGRSPEPVEVLPCPRGADVTVAAV